jgi:hypothetical protein
MSQPEKWAPTTFIRLEEMLNTSMGTARIVTDAGRAYIKALGNRQGPHPLACELVATQLAGWFGLPTFDVGLIHIDADVDEIPFLRGGQATSGTAFVTRASPGHPWGGSPEELDSLVNPEAVSRLVVFDTWTLNCDRHPPDLTARRPNYDNVFLQDANDRPMGQSRLIAMDHTHCFTCGRDLGQGTADIDRVKDERLYGLFPGFIPKVRQNEVETALGRLHQLREATVKECVAKIPPDWEVAAGAREALIELIVRRATFVADTILPAIAEECWPGRLFE